MTKQLNLAIAEYYVSSTTGVDDAAIKQPLETLALEIAADCVENNTDRGTMVGAEAPQALKDLGFEKLTIEASFRFNGFVGYHISFGKVERESGECFWGYVDVGVSYVEKETASAAPALLITDADFIDDMEAEEVVAIYHAAATRCFDRYNHDGFVEAKESYTEHPLLKQHERVRKLDVEIEQCPGMGGRMCWEFRFQFYLDDERQPRRYATIYGETDIA